MHHAARITLFLAIGNITTGCPPPLREDPNDSSEDPISSTQRDQTIETTREALPSAQDNAYAKSGNSGISPHRELSESREDIDKLRARADKSTGAGRRAQNDLKSSFHDAHDAEQLTNSGDETSWCWVETLRWRKR